MRNWTSFLLIFAAGTVFGYLVSEKFTGDSRIEELTERLANLETAQPAPQAPLPQRAVPPAQRRVTDFSLEGAPFRGPEDAPITIVEFSDFQCPYCQRVHPTLQRILATYPQSVKLVFKHNLERDLVARSTESAKLSRYHRLAAQLAHADIK